MQRTIYLRTANTAMHFRNTPVWTEHIKPFWDSKIPDLTTLKARVPGSVLVALDTESYSINAGGPKRNLSGDISELGLAILPVYDGRYPPFYPSLREFYDENGVEAHTIQIHKRDTHRKGNENRRFGDVVQASANDVTSILSTLLSAYDGDIILVGFDLHTELKWIAQHSPSISSLFTAWADVQDLIWHESASSDQIPTRPGLQATMQGLHIPHYRDWRRCQNRHYASNDALRCLLVLASLLSPTAPRLAPPTSLKASFSRFAKLPKPNRKFPFAARMKAIDGRRLSRQTPQSLQKAFARFAGLNGVGLNTQTKRLRLAGVGTWLVSFRDEESLSDFILEVAQLSFKGVRFCVVKDSMSQSRRADQEMPSRRVKGVIEDWGLGEGLQLLELGD
jgi:hypothetical protein